MDELNAFESIHGQPLTVGMSVTVNPANPYADEWEGNFFVTGINWEPSHRHINVTIAESWEDGGTDGWRPEDLSPTVSSKPTEQKNITGHSNSTANNTPSPF